MCRAHSYSQTSPQVTKNSFRRRLQQFLSICPSDEENLSEVLGVSTEPPKIRLQRAELVRKALRTARFATAPDRRIKQFVHCAKNTRVSVLSHWQSITHAHSRRKVHAKDRSGKMGIRARAEGEMRFHLHRHPLLIQNLSFLIWIAFFPFRQGISQNIFPNQP